MNILALIPARAGSKRVPGKNIRELGGKPLIAWTIEAARASRYVTRVIVSTDSEDIAAAARAHGAEVPFMRPESLAGADSTEMEFLEHALDWLQNNENYIPDLIVLLYPTSPFRRAESIDGAIEAMMAHPEADSLRSARKCTEHPYKMWVRHGEYLKPFINAGNSATHTLSYHLLPEVFIQNASIYIYRPTVIREKRTPVGEIVVPFIMDAEESVDINNPHDFMLAEILLERRKEPPEAR
ncbi:MAG: acylneuraminate cytidylyltransferase family protein [Nitrospirae bacterium]|nr:acylneuraminate cytidylyltransferase family protein [Nitrospirota bacterium]